MQTAAAMYGEFSKRTVAVTVGPGVECAMRVHDVRPSYGKWNLLVEPIAGQGSMWVSRDRVRIVEEGWPNVHPETDAGTTDKRSGGSVAGEREGQAP